MNTNSKTGRQEVVAAYVDFDIEDFKDSAGTVLVTAIAAMQIPQGACIIDGFLAIDTAFNGTTPTLTIGDNADDTPDEDRYLGAGSVASTGKIAVLNPNGDEVAQACDVTLKLSAADATEGAGRICLRYVVAGRVAFSQG